jgi:hypothetical protein
MMWDDVEGRPFYSSKIPSMMSIRKRRVHYKRRRSLYYCPEIKKNASPAIDEVDKG